MDLSYIKALHIIFIVTWFAGLFYIVRLFVYHAETAELSEPERSILRKQYKIMERRLWYGITWPSAIFTLVFGGLLWRSFGFTLQGWLGIKLGMVAGLYIYHIICHRIFIGLQNDRIAITSGRMRIWNEVATLFLVAIVFIAFLKNGLDFAKGLMVFVLIAAALFAAIYVYKRARKP